MITEGKLGMGFDIQLGEPLDIWSSGAVGSSARVFHGKYKRASGEYGRSAIKIMRPDCREYALPLFNEEFKILRLLADVQGVVHALEYGFLKLDEEKEYPSDETQMGAQSLVGNLVRISNEEVIEEEKIVEKINDGWLPYIALESRHYSNNLLMHCDPIKTRGKYLDVSEAIQIVVGICDILSIAHKRNIVYRDHKIVHYYRLNGHDNNPHPYILDWNIGQVHKKLSKETQKFDVVQFSARTLHYIFTGRPAPGALAVGPTRPEDIEKSPASYGVDWRFDDKRLPDNLKQMIEAAVNGHYKTFAELKKDILEIK